MGSGLIVKHFYVKLGGPSCIVFEISGGKTDRHTDKRKSKALPPPLPLTWVVTTVQWLL